jgi:VWFA-related protein
MRCTIRNLTVSLMLLAMAAARAQDRPTLTVTSNLVVVPTLVLDAAGEMLSALKPTDFRLFDNGVQQTVAIEDVERQPLAIVVVMQTGGAGSHEFPYYAKLPTMVDYLTGSSVHRVALVTFDSQPEEEWDFSSDVANLSDGLTHPPAGDNGAAIFDAVNHGIDMLQTQPANTRRIILLFSQPQDDGSRVKAEDVVRRLGENNVTIYCVTFSPQKKWLKDQFAGPRHEAAPYQMAPNYPPLLHTFDLLTPLMMAANAMRKDAAGEIATLSGGEAVRFSDRNGLERELTEVANHIPGRYMLTFQPTSNQVGFHTLAVQVPARPGVSVAARTGYWLGGDGGKR